MSDRKILLNNKKSSLFQEADILGNNFENIDAPKI